ncbi:hypothetical protein SESBI_39742 [Sesbania bispinosa]|nr:hypothetical protein SESBI_39742 [Sesbania bispinosa]
MTDEGAGRQPHAAVEKNQGEGSNLGDPVVHEGEKGDKSDAMGSTGSPLKKQVRIKKPSKEEAF